MAEQQNRGILRRYVEMFNSGDWQALDEIMAPDYVDHVAFHKRQSSRDAFKETFATFRNAFPDSYVTVEDVIAEGSKIVWRWTWRGTHAGVFRGVEPSGKQITWTGVIIWRIENGRIVEWWAENDGLGFMRQLGAIPTLSADVAGE